LDHNRKQARVRRAGGRSGRRIHRPLGIVVIGLTPIVALSWGGCSDDDNNAFGPAYVDPGGTHGAEITVSIIGPGRVTTNLSGLDCPSDCFAKYVFTSAAADGASGSVALKAAPTPGAKFKGWSFSTAPVGAKGRGAANCNPVMRAGTDPPVDKGAREIQLPYGEATGTAPAGQEAACSGSTKVPVLYNVTATFETDDPVNLDGGVESGLDGGNFETIYNAPVTNAVAGEVGITQGGYLYWRFTTPSGLSGIAFGSNPDGFAPQAPQIVVTPSSPSISLFEVDSPGVAFQNSLGEVGLIRYVSPTTSIAMGGTAPTCSALAVDPSFNVYCRTASTIVQWAAPNYASGTVLYSGLPSGTDLYVDSALGSLYFSGSSSILSLPISGADGSTATPTTVASGTSGSSNLEGNSSRFFWLTSSAAYASSSKSAPTSVSSVGLPASQWRYLAEDVESPSFFWVASSSSIYHAYYLGNTGPDTTTSFQTGLSIAGMTADATYVYTSHTDGTIRRMSRAGF
jgi:hypothetical protein